MSPSTSYFPEMGKPCIERYASPKVCGVPPHLCDDCRGETFVERCDRFMNVVEGEYGERGPS